MTEENRNNTLRNYFEKTEVLHLYLEMRDELVMKMLSAEKY